MPKRPRTRADCINGPRPCPWVSCRYHLAVDVTSSGSIKVNAPRNQIGGVRTIHPDTTAGDGLLDIAASNVRNPSCALDEADAGAKNLADIARAIGVSRERARQINDAALAKLRSQNFGLAELDFQPDDDGSNVLELLDLDGPEIETTDSESSGLRDDGGHDADVMGQAK